MENIPKQVVFANLWPYPTNKQVLITRNPILLDYSSIVRNVGKVLFKYIGKNLLLYVYIFHIPVYTIVKLVFESAKVENQYLTASIVVVLTIGISYIWVKMTNMIKANMSKRQVFYHGQG